MKKALLAFMLFSMILASACGKQETSMQQGSTVVSEKKDFIEATGVVKSKSLENITLDFPAAVEKIAVRNGQRLKKGDLIMTLNLKDFNSQISNKEKELNIARTELKNAQNMPSGKQRDNAVYIQRQKIYVIESDLKLLKDKLSRTYISGNNIVCDMDNGVVFDIGYEQGDIINSSKKLLSIADTSSIVVDAEIAEEFIRNVKVGGEVAIHPLADSSKDYKGKVLEISNMGVNKNGQTVLPVQISIENQDGFLLPNFNVNLEIKTAQ